MAESERLFLLEVQQALDLEGPAREDQLRVAADLGKQYLDRNAFRQEWYTVMIDKTAAAWQETQGRRHLRKLKRRVVGGRRLDTSTDSHRKIQLWRVSQ